MADQAELPALSSMLLHHLASAGLERRVLEEVQRALQDSGDATRTSDLAKVCDCAMQGQLQVRASMRTGRECSIWARPWTTVDEAKAMLTSQLDLRDADHYLACNGQVLAGEKAIGMYVSPTSAPLELARCNKSSGLAAVLPAAFPPVQKQLIGNALFPQIAKIQPGWAGKITGMLLEMGNCELLFLLESDIQLQAKIEEAVFLLRTVGCDI